MIGLLLVISFGTFVLLQVAPGSLEQTLLGSNKNPSPAALAAIREKYHLNEGLLERYWEWLTAAVRGDFGQSIRTRESVTAAVGNHLMVTLQLTVMAMLVVVCVGIPLGILAALRRGRWLDRATVGVSVMGISAPPFAMAILLLYIFSVALPWLPAYGAGATGVDRVIHLILPAIALAVLSLGLMVKTTRAAFIRELEQDYVVAARARGVSFRDVLWRYVCRNALLPILTVAGLILGDLIGGALLVEVAFSLPGLGSLLLHSVGAFDLPVVLGVALVGAFAVLLLNLVVDLLYAVVDPRVRIGADNA
jgi:peptide/nickel transport system permease protein